tara:strand:- start:208 stop:357 length:150 start_codon:yes stop_codon:yes gene_type:complete
MGPQVSQQEDRLKKDEAGIPDLRRPSQCGQDHLADHGLRDEEQRRAQKY